MDSLQYQIEIFFKEDSNTFAFRTRKICLSGSRYNFDRSFFFFSSTSLISSAKWEWAIQLDSFFLPRWSASCLFFPPSTSLAPLVMLKRIILRLLFLVPVEVLNLPLTRALVLNHTFFFYFLRFSIICCYLRSIFLVTYRFCTRLYFVRFFSILQIVDILRFWRAKITS